MRKTPYNPYPKSYTCPSGSQGWIAKLQASYCNFKEFQHYAETFGLHTKLGYKTIKGAWKSNPLICGSSNPTDFQKIK